MTDTASALLVRPASVAELGAIVRIHTAAFPGFFMTRLGSAFLRRYYDAVLAHPGGLLLLCESAAAGVVGFVSGFTDPPGFYAGMRRRRLAFLVAAIPALMRSPSIAWNMVEARRRVARFADDGDVGPGDVAELSSIAVDPAAGGRGCGRALLVAFIREAAARGAQRVCLTTDATDNEAVNRFYLSAGFLLSRTMERGPGRTMNEYVYDIQ